MYGGPRDEFLLEGRPKEPMLKRLGRALYVGLGHIAISNNAAGRALIEAQKANQRVIDDLEFAYITSGLDES